MIKNLPDEAAIKIDTLIANGFSIQVENEKGIFYQSSEPMLKPLIKCLNQYTAQMSGATVVDKIVGLAAAYLCMIGKVGRVLTPLASQSAEDALRGKGIELIAVRIIPQIMNRDGTAPCPMEQLAASFAAPEEFYAEMKRRMSTQA